MKKKYINDYTIDESVEGGYRYTGIYYTDNIEPGERKRLGMLTLGSAVLQFIAILLAASVYSTGSRTVYVIIPLECTLFCALNLCLGAWRFLKNRNRMEVRHYEESYQRMVQSASVGFFLSLGAAIGQFFVIVKGFSISGIGYEYLLFGMILFVAGLNGFQWKKQRQLIASVSKE